MVVELPSSLATVSPTSFLYLLNSLLFLGTGIVLILRKAVNVPR